MKKLTDKQQKFAEGVAIGLGKRAAAVAAGYSSRAADVQAAELMRKPEIKAAIREAKKRATPGDAPFNMAAEIGVGKDASSMPKDRYDDPLDFYMDMMNHKGLPIAMRELGARQLMPYMHARKEGKGKKETAKDRAHQIANGDGERSNKFQTKRPPTGKPALVAVK